MKTTIHISLRQAASAILLFSCFLMNSQNGASVKKTGENDHVIPTGGGREEARVLFMDLLSFSAVNSNGQVNLTWVTKSESEDGFLVERSVDGLIWEAMTLNVEMRSGDSYYYNCVDPSPFNQEISYYRLKQVGAEGNCFYSDIASVELEKQVAIKLYPNPVVSYVQVIGDRKAADVSTVAIYNAAGHLVKQATGDSTSMFIDVMDLETGNYYALIGSGAKVSTVQFVKN